MTEISIARRVLLAAIGVGLSGWLLRAQLSDALVVRGDGWLYRAHPARALSYYRRALHIDPSDGVAVDRFAFVAMTLHDKSAISEGIQLTSAYLRRGPNGVVLMDRAMAERRIGKAREALADFQLVGQQTGDARAFAFAGFEAEALRRRHSAVLLLHRALQLAPHFPAAAHALHRLESMRRP